MNFGISEQHYHILAAIFNKHLSTGKVIIYGSRAKGDFTARSDVDLVIQQTKTADRQLLANIQDDINDSDFPYLTDIQFYETIKNVKLLEHINRVGKLFYEKKAD